MSDTEGLFLEEPSTSNGRRRKRNTNNSFFNMDLQIQQILLSQYQVSPKLARGPPKKTNCKRKSGNYHKNTPTKKIEETEDMIDNILSMYDNADGTADSSSLQLEPADEDISTDSVAAQNNGFDETEVKDFINQYWNKAVDSKKINVNVSAAASSNSVIEIDEDENVKAKEDAPGNPEKVCCVCLEPLTKDLYVTFCGHVFHNVCITQSMQTLKCCPICRKKLTKKNIHRLFF